MPNPLKAALDFVRHVVTPKAAREANEHAPYETLREDGAFSLRAYPELACAETTVRGPREDAEGEGFSRLFAYIQGKDRPGGEIAMTAPVLHDPDYGAVTPEALRGEGETTVRFVLPSRLSSTTAPPPASPDVRLVTLPAHRAVAITFDGTADDETVASKTEALRAWIISQDLVEAGSPRFAIYDPPFAPPPARRNEVLIPVEG